MMITFFAGHYEKALQREQKLEELERDTVSEPIVSKSHGPRVHKTPRSSSKPRAPIQNGSTRMLPEVKLNGTITSGIQNGRDYSPSSRHPLAKSGQLSGSAMARHVGKGFSITQNFSEDDDYEPPPAPAPPANKSSNTNIPALHAPRRYYPTNY